MIVFDASPRQVIHVLELAGRFTCTWPTDPNSGKREIVVRNVRWALAMTNVIALLISLALGVFHSWNDTIILFKTLSEANALLEVLIDLILCKMKDKELQKLIGKIKTFLEAADERESKIVGEYINRYKTYYSTIAMLYVITGITFSIAPFFSEQELPAEGWIPFSTESTVIYCTVYAVHVYCIFQTALCIGVDFTIALLLGFPAAKLDILGTKLREVSGYEMLVSCIKEHQEIIGFVEDTKATLKTLLLKTNATMGSAVLCGAIPLIYNESLTMTSQFLPMVISGCGRLHVVSWPADDLRESSLRFARSILDVQWIGKTRKMTSTVIIMMQRSQKTFLVTMSGLLPALSMEYYAKFLTTVLSYFMTMRTVVEA